MPDGQVTRGDEVSQKIGGRKERTLLPELR